VNIYTETNFILELAFQQEQASHCEAILVACESGEHNLIIPAYCLAEPHEKLYRQTRDRRELQRTLVSELRQLARSGTYTERIGKIQDIADLLIQSSEEDMQRFDAYRSRLLRISDVISLTNKILLSAATYEKSYDLTPQDALVYASVVAHLSAEISQQSCFLNRNSRDFDTPEIVNELAGYNCRTIPRFDDGERYIHSSSVA
jgi:predicted nucleic acid-binding protein